MKLGHYQQLARKRYNEALNTCRVLARQLELAQLELNNAACPPLVPLGATVRASDGTVYATSYGKHLCLSDGRTMSLEECPADWKVEVVE